MQLFTLSPRILTTCVTANQIPVLWEAHNSGWSSELSAELHLGHFHLLQLHCVLMRASDLTSRFTATLSTCSLSDICSRKSLALNSLGWHVGSVTADEILVAIIQRMSRSHYSSITDKRLPQMQLKSPFLIKSTSICCYKRVLQVLR